ncbi:MAG TPA: hypothetical protein VHT91_44445 [Kofleriaceae bacterium]|nr:hypothetical protein [Kofleriaceae bacterium]
MKNDAPWSAYMALDGPHLDGLIGSAGVLRFDWPERKFYFQHFEGISAAHNVSLAHNAQLALLGNFSQQIVVLDISKPDKIREVRRQSAMYFEQAAYRLRSNTHHLWEPDNQHFIGAIGDHIYRFNVDDLKAPEQLGPHRLENAHELRWDATRRYILIGDLGPERFDVRQVCVFDLKEPDPNKRARVIRVQNNVWHNCVHPTKPLGYALTYSFVTDSEDYVAWSPAFVREYIYEIDLPTAKIVRTWSCGSEFPIHLNSDVEATEDALYIASGGGHSVVRIDLNSFAQADVTLTIPSWFSRAAQWPKRGKNVLGAFSRKSASNSSHYILQTLQVTDWRMADGVYATRVSPDGKYVMVGHRGYNYIAVYERATMKKVYGRVLPFRRDVYQQRPYYRFGWRGHHLGIHHSEIVART